MPFDWFSVIVIFGAVFLSAWLTYLIQRIKWLHLEMALRAELARATEKARDREDEEKTKPAVTKAEIETPAKVWSSEEETIRELGQRFHNFVDEKSTDSRLRELEKVRPFGTKIQLERVKIDFDSWVVAHSGDDYDNRWKFLLEKCDRVTKWLPEIRARGSEYENRVQDIDVLINAVCEWLQAFRKEVAEACKQFGWGKEK
jgi:hypothetical protein